MISWFGSWLIGPGLCIAFVRLEGVLPEIPWRGVSAGPV
jgi:hypothetical protein